MVVDRHARIKTIVKTCTLSCTDNTTNSCEVADERSYTKSDYTDGNPHKLLSRFLIAIEVLYL